MEKTKSSLIFQHVVDSAPLGILPELVETYLLSLMRSDNMNAVVSLVHILLHSNFKHYRFSNQFWSLLTSKSASLGHHGAASLAYHEIINPFVNFSGDGPISEENEHILFLLLPTTIESLAIVFAQNGNHVAVEGLRQYFKRFYSNFGHRDVYQTLYITKVEFLAAAGLFSEALNAFTALAIKYKGHIGYRDPKDLVYSLKYASHMHYKKRKMNIAQNISHIVQEDSDKFNNSFCPDIKFNDYTFERSLYWAILDGVLSVQDLPKFKSLLSKKLKELMARHDSVVDRLLAFIFNNHSSMGKFVIACLCETGHIPEAIAVINKLPSLFPRVKETACITEIDFQRIFKALEIQFQAQESHDCKALQSQLMTSYELCQRLVRNSSMSRACFRSFLQCYFSSPLANIDEINQISESWKSRGGKPIGLGSSAYKNALSCGLSSLDLRNYITENPIFK
ncbi:hypothetical protein METBIDRAFT_36067 [Metschnikowia bicuspidata var. bicuspidata NRRL YB-4993]|uniref:Uncharacterized protein n=1 Tax=Metschnikowia bicuspidata var. bicuspidata NRRL YB-4993 TaxID=869754 RepID=A0A1A0HIS1_9ASCO|nr:hypothetical protein METBIDRAFT_36067 [Metschnikowia bicuspidata var. bicuspidata NRRL YB-4993]OBA23901.1 hypothetical protein METBIDRAFT_36067 [Metschnikowia bicuspidata var. bicuspidata NRRL YB-4993]